MTDLPNIGRALKEQLARAGITDAQALQSAGSKEAWLRIQKSDPSACYMRLCALEGAIRGVRWPLLPPQTKAELKAFYQSHRIKGGRNGEV